MRNASLWIPLLIGLLALPVLGWGGGDGAGGEEETATGGAEPGPACYGAGGPLTITDVNLLLGRLDLDSFNLPAFQEAAEARFKDVHSRHGGTREEVLLGFLLLANDRMASAIRKISVRGGYDPADHALVAFGGAGGQHACAVSEGLGMKRILFPADAGLLSAFGLEQARLEKILEEQMLVSGSEFAFWTPKWCFGSRNGHFRPRGPPKQCFCEVILVPCSGEGEN